MDIQLIANQFAIIDTRLQALEYDRTYFKTEITGERLRCSLDYKGLKNEDWQYERWTFNFDGDFNDYDTISDMFFGINEFISNMPIGDDLKKQSLVRKLEEVKLMTEDLDIDVEIVNPFIAIMDKLATNAITHRKAA